MTLERMHTAFHKSGWYLPPMGLRSGLHKCRLRTRSCSFRCQRNLLAIQLDIRIVCHLMESRRERMLLQTIPRRRLYESLYANDETEHR